MSEILELTYEMADEYMEYLERRMTPGCGIASDLVELAFYSGASAGFMAAVGLQNNEESLFEISAITNKTFIKFLEEVNKAMKEQNV